MVSRDFFPAGGGALQILKGYLRMLTSGMFIRPYASISLREYFATGFEAYYLGQRDELEKISPRLYDKISELHNYQ